MHGERSGESETRERSCVPRRSHSAQAAAGPAPASFRATERQACGQTDAQHRDLPCARCVTTAPSSLAPQTKTPRRPAATAPFAIQKLPGEGGCFLTHRKSPEHWHLSQRPGIKQAGLCTHPVLFFLTTFKQVECHGQEAPWPHLGDGLRMLMPSSVVSLAQPPAEGMSS